MWRNIQLNELDKITIFFKGYKKMKAALPNDVGMVEVISGNYKGIQGVAGTFILFIY